jgi:hypothetical protein
MFLIATSQEMAVASGERFYAKAQRASPAPCMLPTFMPTDFSCNDVVIY